MEINRPKEERTAVFDGIVAVFCDAHTEQVARFDRVNSIKYMKYGNDDPFVYIHQEFAHDGWTHIQKIRCIIWFDEEYDIEVRYLKDGFYETATVKDVDMIDFSRSHIIEVIHDGYRHYHTINGADQVEIVPIERKTKWIEK